MKKADWVKYSKLWHQNTGFGDDELSLKINVITYKKKKNEL